MTPEQHTRLQQLIDDAQTADHEWCESPVTERSAEILHEVEMAVHKYVDELLAAKDAAIKRLKTKNATLKEVIRVKNTGYAYETPEMKALRQKHIEDNERALAEELQHQQRYERLIKDRHSAFREEYRRLQHEALSRLTDPETVQP